MENLQEEAKLIEELMITNPDDLQKIIVNGVTRAKEVSAQIKEFKKRSAEVKIIDNSDKKGFEATKDFLKTVRDVRISLTDEGKVATKPLSQLLNGVRAVYSKCTKELVGIEAPHKAEKEGYESAEQKRKDEAKLEAERLINEKVQKVLAAGLIYNAQNGLYENDNGVSVSRAEIAAYEEERFEKLLSVATEYKSKQDEMLRLEKEKREQITGRRNELLTVGMSTGINNSLVIVKTETQEPFSISAEEIEVLNPFDFGGMVAAAKKIVESNIEFANNIKKEREEFEQQKKDMQAQQEKLKRAQVQLIQNSLEVHGFKFEYGDTIEKGSFVFKNEKGLIRVIVGDALENSAIVDEGIKSAQRLTAERQAEILEENKAAELQQKEDEKKRLAEEKENEKRQLADQKLKEKTEAKNKAACKKDLALADDMIGRIITENDILATSIYEVITPYVDKLTERITVAINEFTNSVQHLRPIK